MARLFFQHLAIYYIENLPTFLTLLAKVGSFFTKYKINHQPIFAKDIKSLAKVVKFRPIWSHWSAKRQFPMEIRKTFSFFVFYWLNSTVQPVWPDLVKFRHYGKT